MKGHLSDFCRVRSATALLALLTGGLLASFASSARALPLQEIISLGESPVVHISVSNDRGAELGTGSGFVVSSDGSVATNHHVVERADRVDVTFHDGRKVRALGVLDFDEDADLALLALPKGTYPKLALAAEPAKQGDSVVIIGSPMGFSGSVSTGIVAAVRPEGATFGNERQPNWTLQLTAAVSPGSSGSPVMNEQGEVVAVAVAALRVSHGQPVNFGVPVASLKKLLASGKRTPQPFRVLRGGRTPLENLLISAGLLGGVGFALGLRAFIVSRRRRRERDLGRGVITSILKR